MKTNTTMQDNIEGKLSKKFFSIVTGCIAKPAISFTYFDTSIPSCNTCVKTPYTLKSEKFEKIRECFLITVRRYTLSPFCFIF
ncbi:hypothetical protein [uncultured Gammaproteobacteria bacterium]|jgi:hypothetical protein|nr:hypothetical protein [uncultured Gammaproteobacteria bacterium]CAC9951551.1 hypothetical protein [uncultured Gammaproteobacteria bacterium]CAC9960920.1 hypothetical protein [uncultured Gammaproteobacteria bacterium]CAC9961301.1 hypothetical protein [uncultured Gammaproteobacteria bacterium]CAC9966760.1 hypothetical protein [uncultured Gammaproteobacteria bacterium]